MDIVSEFTDRYRREYDFYDQAARLAAQTLDSSLQAAGVRSIVTSRAKSASRLEEKCRKRHATKKYTSFEQIYDDIVDLAGVRVALYFPAERSQVDKLVRELFVLLSEPKEFPESAKVERIHSNKKRFSGYEAVHYRVQMRETNLSSAQKRYEEARIEIQVASVLMHAWAEVEHDLLYKPANGKVSDDEFAILDELNGLVLTGEIALERLQKAVERRVAAGGRPFGNHYELAVYLLEALSDAFGGRTGELALGRVDLLFRLLQRLDLAKPDGLKAYIQEPTTNFEQRPLAEQVIDRILAEDESRYEVYKEVRRALSARAVLLGDDSPNPDANEAIGRFMQQWTIIERTVRERVDLLKYKAAVPTPETIELLGLSDPDLLSEFNRIRRIRNRLVHSIDVPNASDLYEATERLREIRDRIVQELNRP